MGRIDLDVSGAETGQVLDLLAYDDGDVGEERLKGVVGAGYSTERRGRAPGLRPGTQVVNLAASRYPASEKERRDKAVKNRGIVAAKMTPAQVAEAQNLA